MSLHPFFETPSDAMNLGPTGTGAITESCAQFLMSIHPYLNGLRRRSGDVGESLLQECRGLFCVGDIVYTREDRRPEIVFRIGHGFLEGNVRVALFTEDTSICQFGDCLGVELDISLLTPGCQPDSVLRCRH